MKARARGRRRRRGADPTRRAIALGLAAVGLAALGLAVASSELVQGLRDGPASLPGLASLRAERFQLHAVELLGVDRLEPAELVARAGLREGIPLLDLDLAAIQTALEAHPRIARCRALRLPPDRLLIEVQERRPLAILAPTGAGLDAAGEQFPLAGGEEQGLPRLEGKPEWALPLLRAAHEAGIELAQVRALAANDVRFALPGLTAWVQTAGDPERSLADWRRLEPSGQLQQSGAREIDLRFPGEAVLRDFETNQGGRDGAT